MKYIKLFESFNNEKTPELVEKEFNLPSGLLSQKWNFPSGFSEDRVWELCDKVMSNPVSNNEENYKELKILSQNLTSEFFPYKGIEELSENIKFDILAGMASRFNFDDIVWFAIDKKLFTHPDSKMVRDNMKYEFGINLDNKWFTQESGQKRLMPSPGWVPSESTLNKLRQFKFNI